MRTQAKKMTQGDLGKAVGTSGDIICKYERDEIKPSIDTAAKVADALGVTLGYHLFATMLAFFAKNKLQALLK